MVKKYPKISIIIPTLNQSGFIGKSIDSVLCQDYPDIELIVVDGGSDDDTIRILKSYGKKISWISEKDKGQSDAINKGLKKSTGEIVTYLNSDDVLLPGSLKQVAEFFLSNPDNQWVTGKCRVIDEKDREIRSLVTLYKNFWLRCVRGRTVLQILNFISQPATFWTRKALEKTGYFDTSLHYAMDYDYWLRLSKIYRLGFIDGYLAAFRMQEKSKSILNFRGLFTEGLEVCKRYNGGLTPFFHEKHDKIACLIYSRMQK